MHHRIAWQGIVPFLSLALSAHLIHGAREILKNIKSLGLQRQLAFAERTGQRGIPYQITGVKRLLAVTTPAIFLQVGRERNAQRQGVSHVATILKIIGIQFLEIAAVARTMLPLQLSTQVDAQLVFLILEVQTVTQLSSEHIAELGRIIIVSYIKILAAQTVKPQTIIQAEQTGLV